MELSSSLSKKSDKRSNYESSCSSSDNSSFSILSPPPKSRASTDAVSTFNFEPSEIRSRFLILVFTDKKFERKFINSYYGENHSIWFSFSAFVGSLLYSQFAITSDLALHPVWWISDLIIGAWFVVLGVAFLIPFVVSRKILFEMLVSLSNILVTLRTGIRDLAIDGIMPPSGPIKSAIFHFELVYNIMLRPRCVYLLPCCLVNCLTFTVYTFAFNWWTLHYDGRIIATLFCYYFMESFIFCYVYVLNKNDRSLFLQNYKLKNKRKKIKRENKRTLELLNNIMPLNLVDRITTVGELNEKNNCLVDEVDRTFLLKTDFLNFDKDIYERYNFNEITRFLNRNFSLFERINEHELVRNEKVKSIHDSFLCFSMDNNNEKRVIKQAICMIIGSRIISDLEFKMESKLRIGIAYGSLYSVVFGSIEKHLTYDVFGKLYYLVLKLQENCSSNHVNCCKKTFEKTKNYFRFTNDRDLNYKFNWMKQIDVRDCCGSYNLEDGNLGFCLDSFVKNFEIKEEIIIILKDCLQKKMFTKKKSKSKSLRKGSSVIFDSFSKIAKAGKFGFGKIKKSFGVKKKNKEKKRRYSIGLTKTVNNNFGGSIEPIESITESNISSLKRISLFNSNVVNRNQSNYAKDWNIFQTKYFSIFSILKKLTSKIKWKSKDGLIYPLLIFSNLEDNLKCYAINLVENCFFRLNVELIYLFINNLFVLLYLLTTKENFENIIFSETEVYNDDTDTIEKQLTWSNNPFVAITFINLVVNFVSFGIVLLIFPFYSYFKKQVKQEKIMKKKIDKNDENMDNKRRRNGENNTKNIIVKILSLSINKKILWSLIIFGFVLKILNYYILFKIQFFFTMIFLNFKSGEYTGEAAITTNRTMWDLSGIFQLINISFLLFDTFSFMHLKIIMFLFSTFFLVGRNTKYYLGIWGLIIDFQCFLGIGFAFFIGLFVIEKRKALFYLKEKKMKRDHNQLMKEKKKNLRLVESIIPNTFLKQIQNQYNEISINGIKDLDYNKKLNYNFICVVKLHNFINLFEDNFNLKFNPTEINDEFNGIDESSREGFCNRSTNDCLSVNKLISFLGGLFDDFDDIIRRWNKENFSEVQKEKKQKDKNSENTHGSFSKNKSTVFTTVKSIQESFIFMTVDNTIEDTKTNLINLLEILKRINISFEKRLKFVRDIEKEIDFVTGEKNDESEKVEIRMGVSFGSFGCAVLGSKKFLFDILGSKVSLAIELSEKSTNKNINITKNNLEISLGKKILFNGEKIKIGNLEITDRGKVFLKNEGMVDCCFVKKTMCTNSNNIFLE